MSKPLLAGGPHETRWRPDVVQGPEFATLITIAGGLPSRTRRHLGRQNGEEGEKAAGGAFGRAGSPYRKVAKGAGQNLQFSGESISIRALVKL